MKKQILAWLFIILFAQLLVSIFAIQQILPPRHLLLEKQPNDAGHINRSYSISRVVKDEIVSESKGVKGGTGGANVVVHPRPTKNRAPSLFVSTSTSAFCLGFVLLLIFPF